VARGDRRATASGQEQVTIGISALPVPVSPKVTDAPGATVPFQLALRTVTAVPDWLYMPFHTLVTAWPLGHVHDTAHAPIGVLPRLVTFTSAWNPPCHVPVIV
jgi:hypothetical protein